MAHFARVADGIVSRIHVLANAVITDENGDEQETLGQEFLADLHGAMPQDFVQCSYTGKIRGRYPATGDTYDPERNIFIPPKPFESWVLDEETCLWEAPVPKPEGDFEWDESAGDWVAVPEPTE